jgi:tRNA A-37 threonylcarbamoyl transferase component Bud32
MAPLLGDRYLDSPPRPFLELAVSDQLRRAGVFTPRVLCAVVTSARPGYRGDLGTEWLEPGHDLEELLAPNRYPVDVRISAMRAAGALVGRAHRYGLDHADLNIGNVFVQPSADGQWRAALLDLDRARIAEPDAARANANLERFQRSLKKVRRAGRVTWSRVELDAFKQAYDEVSGT